jgi:anti-anti-sigma regulatory factor
VIGVKNLQITRFAEEGRRVLRILGTFDADAARELIAEVCRDPARDVVVDVALVRGFDEVGVAALARLVRLGGGRRVALRGLSTHQVRILRYLGLELSSLGAA